EGEDPHGPTEANRHGGKGTPIGRSAHLVEAAWPTAVPAVRGAVHGRAATEGGVEGGGCLGTPAWAGRKVEWKAAAAPARTWSDRQREARGGLVGRRRKSAAAPGSGPRLRPTAAPAEPGPGPPAQLPGPGPRLSPPTQLPGRRAPLAGPGPDGQPRSSAPTWAARAATRASCTGFTS